MDNIKYVFRLTSYDINRLLPQVSKALEKRTEIVSRERYPNLWKNTDRLNAASQGQTQSRGRTRFMSIVCLALGIFLFVPGLVKPQELLVPLLVGTIAIGAGIGGLCRSRKNKKNPFDKSAKKLLASKDNFSAEQSIEVSFLEEGMTIPADNGSAESVPYSDFECIIETADIFLLVYDTRATLLQKHDLIANTVDEFRGFITNKVVNYNAM